MPVKDITLLISHPDDELLFAWPVIERAKKIICASSDRYNPSRAWCSKRGDCLREVGKILDAEVIIHENDSEFYRTETRNGSLKNLLMALMSSVGNPGVLFTHNSWGEYFHIDHLLMHNVGRTIKAQTGCEMLVSDIAVEVNWMKIVAWPQGELILRHTLDRARFDSLKAIYDARGCWTWSHEPVTECGVYRI